MLEPVFAGWFTLNGNGEMTGTTWIEEYGELVYPLAITNTNSVGTVRDALIEWGRKRLAEDAWNCCLPVVAETWDGSLNDIFGFHVKPSHVFAALEAAAAGPVQEGAVGGGTGMQCLGFKGGIGTSSRRVRVASDTFTVGVLVQCNFGSRNQLRIAGIPVGREIVAPPDCYDTSGPLDSARARLRCPRAQGSAQIADPALGYTPSSYADDHGSIIVVIATDAPLLPHQLKRIAKRASLGIGRMGGAAGSGSGDIFLAFSTLQAESSDSPILTQRMVHDRLINPLYEATIQATEESIINAMLAARTMTGADYYRVTALPHDQLKTVLARYNRLAK
jgi:D-aminopeptidase